MLCAIILFDLKIKKKKMSRVVVARKVSTARMSLSDRFAAAERAASTTQKKTATARASAVKKAKQAADAAAAAPGGKAGTARRAAKAAKADATTKGKRAADLAAKRGLTKDKGAATETKAAAAKGKAAKAKAKGEAAKAAATATGANAKKAAAKGKAAKAEAKGKAGKAEAKGKAGKAVKAETKGKAEAKGKAGKALTQTKAEKKAKKPDLLKPDVSAADLDREMDMFRHKGMFACEAKRVHPGIGSGIAGAVWFTCTHALSRLYATAQLAEVSTQISWLLMLRWMHSRLSARQSRSVRLLNTCGWKKRCTAWRGIACAYSCGGAGHDEYTNELLPMCGAVQVAPPGLGSFAVAPWHL